MSFSTRRTTDPALPGEKYKIGAVYEVTGRSMLLFERVPSGKNHSSVAA